MVKIRKFSRDLALLLKSRVGRYEPPRFSGITGFERLDRFNIISDDAFELRLKPGHAERAAMSSLLGKEHFWSSTNLYRHLEVLNGLNEEGARPWVDAFLFRASAMMSSNKRMVLSLEQAVQRIVVHPSSTTTHHGFIEYAAVIVDAIPAEILFDPPTCPTLRNLKPCTFFVAEAKVKSIALDEHLPQVIGEMYACAKYLE